jgi:Chaperone of endosialidase
MKRLIQLEPATSSVLITFALLCVGFLRTAQAVVPPPDGGYPGFNTAEGQNALFSLTTGAGNTAVGWFSLFSDTEGSFNTATGAGALLFNTADNNTAFGAAALLFNIDGFNNTAVGTAALLNNMTGSRNTAIGAFALQFNDTSNNTAIGFDALSENTTGSNNTAIGDTALGTNTEGGANTAIGRDTLANNTVGDRNTAIGRSALFFSTGDSNIALGFNAGSGVTTASNVISIGAFSGENVDDSCFIGNIYSNVQPIVGTDPDSVTITSTGRLGRGNVSSRRYKHDIQPMNKSSEVLYALKPVSFRYNKEYDATQTLAFGLIAEEVAEVIPDLVGRNPEGEPESVRYEQINAMLLNEFLKEHRKVQELESRMAEQEKQIESLAAGLQKVSAQLEISRPDPQIAANP